MYLTGTIEDFEQRLHQLPLTSGELDSFYEEASGYGEQLYLTGKWDKEFSKKEAVFIWDRPI